MLNLEILGLHHIQLAIPKDGEQASRGFYSGLLGLMEVPKPVELAQRGGLWFEGQGVRVHLGVEDPFYPARKAHPAFEVSDVLAARQHLSAANPTEISMVSGIKRFYISDPFGNRIEILETD